MAKKKKKKFIKVLIIVFIVILIIINAVGIYVGDFFYDKVCTMYFNKNASSYQMFKSTFDNTRFNSLEKEDITVNSNFGYKLSGTYILNKTQTQDTVVIVHGITGSRWESMKYADIYLNLGFNVLIYDSRYHGKSGGNNISLGYFEKYDLDNCVKWVRKRNPSGIIGVHGESLGAATALLQANMNEKSKDVKFYVVDCAFSDLPQLFDIRLKDETKKYSRFVDKGIIFFSSMVALYKSGFSLYSISPIKAISNVETPIMFVHGADDDLIPPTMSMDLYMEKTGSKYLYIAPNAGHAQSYLHNKEEYASKVTYFLTYNKIMAMKQQNTNRGKKQMIIP